MTDNSDLEFAEDKSIADRPLTPEHAETARIAVNTVDNLHVKRAHAIQDNREERVGILKKIKEWANYQNSKSDDSKEPNKTDAEPVKTAV